MKILSLIILSILLTACGSSENKAQSTANVTTTQEVVRSSFDTKITNPVYAKCVSCHGAKAEKKALNKSQIIAGWSVAKITKALHGYKNGTYGGDLKQMMQAQVTSLSNADIKSVASYISKL